LGIGLTLVKTLVEMHGGTVTAMSAGLGAGSEFTVRLPLVLRQVRHPGVNHVAEGRRTIAAHRLMVVDDNRDAADSLALLLRLQGHEVAVAHSGESALETAESFRPEMIFLDIGMPGMDGYEVALEMRKRPELRGTLLTALTGWGQPEDRRRTLEAGFDYHLIKPAEPTALSQILDELTRKHH
jgi:CheY-like chemotaxis protein